MGLRKQNTGSRTSKPVLVSVKNNPVSVFTVSLRYLKEINGSVFYYNKFLKIEVFTTFVSLPHNSE